MLVSPVSIPCTRKAMFEPKRLFQTLCIYIFIAFTTYMYKQIKNSLHKNVKVVKKSFNYCSSESGQNSVIPVVCNVPE